MIGRVVSERYKILKYLGGGMSSVYLAHDIILDREVVVKLIKVDHHNRDKSKARFQREVESTIQLSHPNIVSVLDVDESEEYHLLVTEVVHGPTLKEYIRDTHPVPLDEAVRISVMILQGIRHAHHAGIIHRDIKPQNILLDDNQRVKITDFGIAKALSETRMTETNQVMGSVQYISPEQAKGRQTDERTDIYSFGIVLYELLTGELPFDGETPVSVALKHISEPMPDVSKLRDVPQGLVNIILKCTEKDPYDRYRHADDVIHAIGVYKDNDRPYAAPVKKNDEKTKVTPVINPAEPAGQEESGKKKKSKKRRLFLLWIIPLILLLSAGGVLASAFWPIMETTVAMPDLQDTTVEEAEQILNENDLAKGETTEEYNDSFEENHIIETAPVSGKEIEKGSTVDFVVSLGEEPYTMEDFTGDSYEDVSSTINSLGFSLDMEEQYDDSEPGTILSQSIEPGTDVHPGEETLKLTVSRGLEPIEIVDYTGESYETAYDELTSQGFNVKVSDELHNSDVPEGSIISQSPNYGDFLPGSTIEMVVSLGKEPGEKQYVQNVTIPYLKEEENTDDSASEESTEESTSEEAAGESYSEEESEENSGENDSSEKENSEPEPQNVEIFIEDKDNDISEVSDSFEMTEEKEYTINLTIEEGETASYKIVIDGKTEMEEEVSY
ncbi:Stk1 family PASTA domain-containing Ser/Thr kinase [Salinicoccus sp. HZC-1]|uniref:Stk1 family PASTA domain-containing Ser/Thr kinase n=1 Tax=Salinicoccus sp. HZC-1 TaxID=3385497 RepID=UPI00398B636C